MLKYQHGDPSVRFVHGNSKRGSLTLDLCKTFALKYRTHSEYFTRYENIRGSIIRFHEGNLPSQSHHLIFQDSENIENSSDLGMIVNFESTPNDSDCDYQEFIHRDISTANKWGRNGTPISTFFSANFAIVKRKQGQPVRWFHSELNRLVSVASALDRFHENLSLWSEQKYGMIVICPTGCHWQKKGKERVFSPTEIGVFAMRSKTSKDLLAKMKCSRCGKNAIRSIVEKPIRL